MKLIVSLTSFILIIALQTSQIRSFSVPAVRNSYEPIRLNDSDPRYRRDIGNWLSGAWTDAKDLTVGAALDTKDWTVGAALDTKDWTVGAALDTKDWTVKAAKNTEDWTVGAVMDTKNWTVEAAKDTKDWTVGAAMDTKDWTVGAAKDTKDWTVGAAMDTKNWTVETATNTKDFVIDLTEDDEEKTINFPTYPNWMGNRTKILGHLKMREVFLPGTHDSAAYKLGTIEPYKEFVFKLPSFLHPLMIPGKIEKALGRFSLTQDLSVYNQLLHGARYLDIRVGRYPQYDDVFWCTHGPITLVPLKTVIIDVKNFLNIYKDEIIIFDVQEFTKGFETIESHYELIDFLEKEFAGYFLKRPAKGWSITLGEIWNSNKRVIIGYDDTRFLPSRTSMWQAVRHQWGDVRTVESLYNHLNEIETQAAEDKNPSPRPRAAMAELTGNIQTITQMQNIRTMSKKVDIHVAKWYSDNWNHTANIVAVDFIENSGIVVTAIEWNDRRAAGH